jgi:hypothetical protein
MYIRVVPDFLGARCEIRNRGLIHTQYIYNIQRIQIIMHYFQVYKMTNIKYSKNRYLLSDVIKNIF